MNHVYFVAPLVGLAIFGGVHAHHARGYAARAAEAQRIERAAREAKESAANAAKAHALEVGRLAQLKRTEENAEKAREAERQTRTRRELEEKRIAAMAEAGRLRPQLAALHQELESMQTSIARDEAHARQLQRRILALHDHEKQAVSRHAALEQLRDRLEHVDLRRPHRPAGTHRSPQGAAPDE